MHLAFPTKACAMVGHHLVADWLKVGWMVVADLGEPHGQWSVLMAWRCCCRDEPVKPKGEG
jgi:hypothetical protein